MVSIGLGPRKEPQMGLRFWGFEWGCAFIPLSAKSGLKFKIVITISTKSNTKCWRSTRVKLQKLGKVTSHFDSREACYNNRFHAKVIARTIILDVDFDY